MAQQTAMQQLIEYLDPIHSAIIYKANELLLVEKEQHGKTWDKALDAYEDRGHLYIRAWTDFDEYYNKSYSDNQ